MSAVVSIVGSVGGMTLTALNNEARTALEFGRELNKLKTWLDNVKAYLTDTENLKGKREIHKRTLKLLRDITNKADDVITDCIIRSEYQREGSCSSCSCSELAFRYGTGKKLKDINAQMKDINDQVGGFLRPQVPSIQSDSVQQVIGCTSRDSIPSDKIVGRDSDVDEMKDWILLPDGDVHRIGIVGVGGLGKTTIAQKIVGDERISNHFEKIIWVSVSEDFNKEKIMRSMLEQLNKYEPGSSERQMQERIHQLLAGAVNPYLIVMDDVWNLDYGKYEWWSTLSSSLKRSNGKSSCIIITTRNEDVAIGMGVDTSRIYRPKVLSPEEGWLLFCKFAFAASEGICPDTRHEEVGKEILDKCGGLPLAIKTIAASMAKVQGLRRWKKTRDDLHQLTASEEMGAVMASLQLSYDALPPHLKILLLCFSIYPEDTEIRAEQLIHWWVGEGLVRNKDNSKTSIELGFEYLSELADRGLVEVMERRGYDGRICSCKMHDLVRDLTVKIAGNESFCSFEGRRQKLTEESRWFGITEANGIDANSLKSSWKVRALLLMPRREVFSLCKNVDPLHSLRVLDLSQSKLESAKMEDLLSWIFALKRLAYLNLSGASGLKAVSSSIRKLRNLQVLILNGCSDLVMLHKSVTKLKMLIILDLGSCGLPYLPRGIGQLSRLQELSGLKVRKNNKRSCQLLELKKLTELRVLHISLSDESELSEDECNIFSGLKKLKVLSINTEGGTSRNFQQMLDRLTPPKDLQELSLRHYRYEILPKWVHPEKLSNLQYLCIENGDLGNIKSESIWKIDGLCLKFLPNLELEWKDLQEKMPDLSYLEVAYCFKLKNFPCPVDKPGFWRKPAS